MGDKIMDNYFRIGVVLLLCLPAYGAGAQDCRATIAPSAEDNRYTDHSDGTITDGETRLMWKKCSQGFTGDDCMTGSEDSLNWQQKLQAAEDEDFASYSDWRLPNINELTSLIEVSCIYPAINETLFPNLIEPSVYWSSSPTVYNSDLVSAIVFHEGGEENLFKDSAHSVRLVRGGE
ncbi:MAG: DUF1566 domain-containing protein [Gammaproteobacteria bacterium]|nr:DUF1566 domain-containing protein [Gammaproteobacteria bacterium]